MQTRKKRWLGFPAALSALLILSSGCAHTPHVNTQPVAESAASEVSAEAYADQLLAKAVEADVWISPILIFLARQQEGEMIGLEFRLKSRESLQRKIESRMFERGIADAQDVSIRDALRYTMQLGDQPAGHHNSAVAQVLATMEELGHEVITVKNYWPRGDDYSGINTTMRAPNGLAWELQFHTPESFELKMNSHGAYEQVRQIDASTETRRALFEEVAAQWQQVPVPEGILEPGSLHPLEQVILRPTP